jgi:hypothetical protein
MEVKLHELDLPRIADNVRAFELVRSKQTTEMDLYSRRCLYAARGGRDEPIASGKVSATLTDILHGEGAAKAGA